MDELIYFRCSICFGTMEEPMSTYCGHTYCHSCILTAIDINSRCPQCGSQLTRDQIIPNFSMRDVVNKCASSQAKKSEVESTVVSSTAASGSFLETSDDIVKYLTTTPNDKLCPNDMDVLLTMLREYKEIKAANEEDYKKTMTQEFLSNLLNSKRAKVEQMTKEINVIKRDMSLLKAVTESGSDVGVPNQDGSGVGPSSSKFMKFENYYSSSPSGIGFNTQPLKNVEFEQNSIPARKKRMFCHFDEIAEVYFDMKVPLPAEVKNTTNDNVDDDATVTVPNGLLEEMSDKGVLENFTKALSHITQYHALKPLATFSFSSIADTDMLSNSNMVTSIEFDKDNEFFAVAGVNKRIKIFDYVNIIGSGTFDPGRTQDIHSPGPRSGAEISCDEKISCVAWNNFYKNQLASSDYDGCVKVWDVESGTQLRNLNEHTKRAWSVDWSKGNPNLLASGSDDCSVKLWTTKNVRSVANLILAKNVCSVKFCPENTFAIAVGSTDRCVHYYDFRNLKEPIEILRGHQKPVSHIRFESRTELVSASVDNTIKLWNLGKESESMSCCVRSFTGHVNRKNFVGLSTDGNYIASGSENNSVYVYCKYLAKPLFSFKFENFTNVSMFGRQREDENPTFVSAIAWKTGSPVMVAGNSEGFVKILELM